MTKRKRMSRARAERHPQAKLTRALGDGIGHDRVQSNRGEKEGHPAEDCQQRYRQALRVTHAIDLLLQSDCVQAARDLDRARGFRVPNAFMIAAGALLRPDDEAVLDDKILANRHIKKWCRLLKLGPVVRIFCHAHDLHPFVFHLEALTDQVFSRPIFCRHRLIDDRDRWRVFVIVASEFPAGDNRDADCR